MKKLSLLSVCLLLSLVAVPVFAQGGAEDASANGGFVPSKEIEWIVTSSPGGGSDIYTRMISDIMTREGLVTKTFLVNNKTDGGGEVGRLQVSQTRAGSQANHTLLTFNSGDLMPMCLNTNNRVENFTPIAVMAVDKQLLFVTPQAKYQTFASAIEAAKNGTQVVIAGSKGDDIATYEALIAELGVTENQIAFITHSSTGDAITAGLGNHVDIVLSKPAAAAQYVLAGKLIPILALSNERYDSAELSVAPTLSEVGDYKNVEVPVWRGVVGPKNMTPEAAAYWSDMLEKVSRTDAWKTDYIEKNGLIPQFMNQGEATKFMADYQADYLKKIGKSK
ncbi:MAG: tripartite tricarboxylate transporter substrate binding protein [Sphaerochaetaceae bacterium]|nr:tripartite tricarboxylate transporter substrate binding protein [Sphaerochaetaceae bacterium]